MKIKKIIKKILSRGYKFYTLKILYPFIYRLSSTGAVNDKKVVFIEVRGNKISDNFALIYKRFESMEGYNISEHFLGMSFAGRREYRKNCIAMLKDIGDARFIFLNDSSNVTSCIPLRKESVLTQVWHGCGAFKKFGMSTAELIFGDNRKTLMKYPYHRNYSHVTVSSPEVIWAYEEAMSLEGQKGVVKALGLSRTDVFFQEEYVNKSVEKIYRLFPCARGKKIILYAPTFRGRVAKAKAPDKLDIPMLYKELGQDYVMLIKHHPFVKRAPEIDPAYAEFAKSVTTSATIEELLCASDICISDYSSLIFEYSLFSRPMIFFAYDLDEYYDWRGFFYDYKQLVPGPIFNNTKDIVSYIKDIEHKFQPELVENFRKKYMSACDGHATDRIMKLLLEDKTL